ncbi:hypothetical protein GGR42_003419 [Saonia flava]|uniref:Uncharacterized protein n=1 Tax=Saonia flava TaxID=523696 RepID=A0A846QX42_9FLAO|nr:hypothetical protein [Saonia flava]NJB72921.1 hypothetical protein [Saonia flava]
MKKYLKIYLTVFVFLPALGLGQDFELMEVERKAEKDTIGDFPIFETYHLDGYCFAIGTDPKNDSEYDLKMFVFNPSTDLVYKSPAQVESYTFSLKFFQSKTNSNLYLILAHASNEYSWGNEVFRFEKGRIDHLGLLDLATFDLKDEPWDIASYTEIYKNGQNLLFEFNKDTLIFNPGGRKEKMVESKNVHYLWDGQKMELKNNR